MKIKTIDIHALEWFDKTYGNSYFAATVTINYGMKNEKRIVLPFQYGYGDKYKDSALKALIDAKYIQADDRTVLWRYCEDHKIILRTSKQEGCKKRDLKAIV